jgi:hypothetical protein
MTLYQRYKRLTFWNKLGVIASILTVITFVVWIASPLIPERSKPKPHFAFELRMADATWFDRVKLTNDFLSHNIDNNVHKVLGCLFVPIQNGKTNAELIFSIENESEIIAENIEVAIAVPKGLQCIPDPRWSRLTINSLVSGPELMGIITETNEMESFGFFPPHALLPKDTGDLPYIELSDRPSWATMAIIARAKDWPDTAITFNLFFMKNSLFETNDFHRPFVLLGINFNSMLDFPISPKTLKELQK